jgi:cytochrome c-type biogenesis protein CcmH/NrfG/mono/diheme cytochrome c family protein
MALDTQTRIAVFGVWALIGAVAFAGRPQTTNPSGAAASPPVRASTLTQSASAPTFARDIAPIIYRHCASCHHSERGGDAMAGMAPFPLITYLDVKRRAADVARVTRSRFMPPWLPEPGFGDFVDENRLSVAQIRLISDWMRIGAPEGPAAEIPPPPEFAEGWQLGKPDLVLESERALSVPASGSDVFWNFIFPTSLKTARFVRAIEVHPGSDSSVIHHANVVVDAARSARRRESEPGAGFAGMDIPLEHSPFDIPGHFLFWKPGAAPWIEPDGLAWKLDPGADLVLNAHFMPMGMTQEAKPSIGLYFTDKPPDRFPMLIELENDDALDIPPGARDFAVGDDFRLPGDVEVLAVYPHAHYLGHEMEGYATLPNGRRKWLIRIGEWDPAWQAVYHYREPVFLPKGSVISMRYRFDNSAANPRNPNSPPRRVQSGNQATDEMAHLWLQILPRDAAGDQRVEIEVALLRHRVEKYRDDFDARISLGALLLARFDPAGAVAALEQAVQLDPKHEETRRFLGMALEGVGRSAEAIEQWRVALELQPDDVKARYDLARALVKSGKLDEALEHFRAVTAADPRNANLLDDFGEFLMQRGRAAEALEEFNAALEIEPSQERALKDRDLASERLKDR